MDNKILSNSLLCCLTGDAEYCDERVYVHLSVCLHLPKLALPNVLPVDVARFSSEYSATCYVFPVLWMTSYFPIVGAYGVWCWHICVIAVLEQVVINLQRIRQGPRCLTLSQMMTCGSLPPFGSVQY